MGLRTVDGVVRVTKLQLMELVHWNLGDVHKDESEPLPVPSPTLPVMHSLAPGEKNTEHSEARLLLAAVTGTLLLWLI